MVSTRTTKVMGSVEAKKDEDVLHVIEAYIKGQRIQRVMEVLKFLALMFNRAMCEA